MQRQFRMQLEPIGDLQQRIRVQSEAIAQPHSAITARTATRGTLQAAACLERAEPVADMAERELREIAHGSFQVS